MSAASRIEGLAGGSRGSGGITGAGGRYVNPVYKEVGPTVKVKPADPTGRATFNVASARRAMEAKSGAAARIAAQKLGVTGKKGVQPPIKINTNPYKK